MAKQSKWTEIFSPDEPAADVARRTLEARLKLVWRYLPDAAEKAEKDCEFVHQLRVSTRRAMAAVDIFDALLPRRRGRWYRKQLKRVRRAAGDARDLDVLAQRMKAEPAMPPPENERLVKLAERDRRDAQSPVADVFQRLQSRNFADRLPRFIEKVRARHLPVGSAEPTIRRLGQLCLMPRVEEFFQAAHAGLDEYAELHQFRIQGKRLRYALEIFAGAFDPRLRNELYSQIEHLQQLLGDINDRVTARNWAIGAAEDADCESQDETLLRQLAEFETSAILQAKREFTSWWSDVRANQLRRDLLNVLSDRPTAIGGDTTSLAS